MNADGLSRFGPGDSATLASPAFAPISVLRERPIVREYRLLFKETGYVPLQAASEVDHWMCVERLQHGAHHAGTDPLQEPPVTCLIGRILSRQVRPTAARTQDVQNTVENLTAVSPGAPAAIVTAARFRNNGLEHRPLIVSQVFRLHQ